ncbi:hypothetical protein AB0N14_09750 [Streptomyces sp. NPDC051104]|uniref:hypothetical protein n=1 Tax=Streptomyces sp. NPDC051104 TaxID=3155044 RepID=UPI00342C1A2C
MPGKLVIASQKGVGSLGAPTTQLHGLGTMPGTGHSVYSSIGTVSVVAKPTCGLGGVVACRCGCR